MKNSALIFCVISFLLFVYSCKKDNNGKTNCSLIKQAVAEGQTEVLKTEVDKMIQRLTLSSSGTYIEQEKNLNKFVNALKDCDDVEASLLCVWCIQTLPEQSEVNIKFTLNGSEINKVIDLIKTPDNRFRFSALH